MRIHGNVPDLADGSMRAMVDSSVADDSRRKSGPPR